MRCAFVAGIRKCADRRKSLVGRTAKRAKCIMCIESFIKRNKQGDGGFMRCVSLARSLLLDSLCEASLSTYCFQKVGRALSIPARKSA